MSIEVLRSNIERELELIREVSLFYSQLSHLSFLESQGRMVNKKERDLLQQSLSSLLTQLKIINSAIPSLLKEISVYKKLDKEAKPSELIKKIDYQEKQIAVPKDKEKEFLETVKTPKSLISTSESQEISVKKANTYVVFANRIFRNVSNNLVKKGYFDMVNLELRKITSSMVTAGYVSVILLSTILVAILALIVGIILMFLKVDIIIALSLIFLAPIIAFFLLYSYPSSQRKSLEKEINQELPFVTIYMSAIATSGIEPSRIFGIMVSTKDYPATQREMKKLLNYINFYGYDLVSALRIVSKNNPSKRLALLLNGLATTITSGGGLNNFLDKHAETLLFDYRLERERYTKIAETFMDIYISVVIAAPMIMMMLFVLLGLTGFGGGFFSPGILSGLIVFIVSALNILFLLFINMKQPQF